MQKRADDYLGADMPRTYWVHMELKGRNACHCRLLYLDDIPLGAIAAGEWSCVCGPCSHFWFFVWAGSSTSFLFFAWLHCSARKNPICGWVQMVSLSSWVLSACCLFVLFVCCVFGCFCCYWWSIWRQDFWVNQWLQERPTRTKWRESCQIHRCHPCA